MFLFCVDYQMGISYIYNKFLVGVQQNEYKQQPSFQILRLDRIVHYPDSRNLPSIKFPTRKSIFYSYRLDRVHSNHRCRFI